MSFDAKIAREQYIDAVSAERENIRRAQDDIAFAAGEQWEVATRQERETDRRPCLTFDRTMQFVRQVTGDIRLRPPGIRVSPVDDGADKRLAEVIAGQIRHIERVSNAQTAYTHAVEGAAMCGQGHFRLMTRYCDDDSFDQDLRIDRIRDHLSVTWDHHARDADRGDASFCFVTDRVSLAAFKAKYPKASTTEFERDTPDPKIIPLEWWDRDSITVAEYWTREMIDEDLYQLDDGSTIFAGDVDDEYIDVIKPRIRNQRKAARARVTQTLMNGVEALDETTVWLGRRIPIFTVVGQEVDTPNGTVRMGLIRPIKDAMRTYNYMRSAAVEAMALQPKAPIMATVDQVAGYEDLYKKAIRSNVPFLLFKPDKLAPSFVPQRMMPPTPPVGFDVEAQRAVEDMYGGTGIYPASLGQRSNETSGRAIIARQREGETGTYLYVDNLARAISAMGKEIVYILPKLYDTERVIRILGEDEAESVVRINVPHPTETGVYRTILRDDDDGDVALPSLDAGKYDVHVSAGPSFATRREEARESMMAMAQALPQTMAIAADLLVANMDWPGAEPIAERLKRAVPPQLLSDQTEQPQAPPPDPKAMASAAKDAAAADKTIAEARGIELENMAKTIEMQAMMGTMQQAVAAAIAQALPIAVQQTIAALVQPQPSGSIQ